MATSMTRGLDMSALPCEIRFQIWDLAAADMRPPGRHRPRVLDVVPGKNGQALGAIKLPEWALSCREAFDRFERMYPFFCRLRKHTRANFALDVLRWRSLDHELRPMAGFCKECCNDRVRGIVLHSTHRKLFNWTDAEWNRRGKATLKTLPLDRLHTPRLENLWFEYFEKLHMPDNMHKNKKYQCSQVSEALAAEYYCHVFRYWPDSDKVEVACLCDDKGRAQMAGPLYDIRGHAFGFYHHRLGYQARITIMKNGFVPFWLDDEVSDWKEVTSYVKNQPEDNDNWYYRLIWAKLVEETEAWLLNPHH